MASSIIISDAIQGETFLPGQIFVLGGFALRIESYAHGHQVRFGSLNYVADIRGDLILDGFGPMTAAPCHHDEHDLNLSSDHTQEIVPVAALALDPEKIAPSEGGKLNPAMEAAV